MNWPEPNQQQWPRLRGLRWLDVTSGEGRAVTNKTRVSLRASGPAGIEAAGGCGVARWLSGRRLGKGRYLAERVGDESGHLCER